MFNERTFFWLIAFLLVGAFVFEVSAILLPFVIAMILTFFLDPVVGWLMKIKIPRGWASVIVVVIFLLIICFVLIKLIPLIFNQLKAFSANIPKYKNLVESKLLPYIIDIVGKVDPTIVDNIRSSMQELSASFFSHMLRIVSSIWRSGIAAVNLLALIFLTPILTFYFLKDWQGMLNNIYKLVPVKHLKEFKNQLGKVNDKLSGYIRGQTHVCLFLAAFYSAGLSLTGMSYGLSIGVATGLLAYIPYAGFLIGAVAGLIVAYLEYGFELHFGFVILVFLIGQILEGNFVTPKLVGNKVNLHPIWIIFALLAGGLLFGFIGVLFAIPVAAVIGVFIRFFIGIYRHSHLYK